MSKVFFIHLSAYLSNKYDEKLNGHFKINEYAR